VAGKVTVGLASHWPCVTDSSGITTYGLMALGREMSTLPIPSSSVEHCYLTLSLFMPTPFDAAAKFDVVTHIGRGLVFRGQPRSCSKGGGAQHFQILGRG